MARHSNDTPVTTDSRLFLRALRVVLTRTPLWLVAWAALVLVSLSIALAWHGWFATAAANRYAVGEIAHSLDRNFRHDHAAALEGLNQTTKAVGAGAVLIATLIGIFVAGGWLQVTLERTRGQTLRRFFYGGARYFWRFFRFCLLSLLVLAGMRWVFYELPWNRLVLEMWMEVPKSDWKELETLDSEMMVRRLGWLQDGLMTLGFMLVIAWGAFSRTRLALHDTHSAVWAGLCTFFVMLRHPIKTLRPLGFLFLVELLLVTSVAGGLTRWIDAGLVDSPSWVRVAFLFAIGTLALMWREITRGAKYYAAVKVSQEVVKPLSRPDPWKSIGGPGGPQYPVDDRGDEYGVAL